MTGIVTIISAVLQLVYLVLKNKFEADAAERTRKDVLHVEASQAIKSGNLSAITATFDKLRQ